MRRTRLGSGPDVGAIGLGCAGMSGAYGSATDALSSDTIRAALDAGITLIDTADHYGLGHDETLIGRTLPPGLRETAVLSVKFGALFGVDGGIRGINGRPDAIPNFLGYSLQRLGTDYVDIYRPARLDPAVPIEDTVGAIAELVEEGYVRSIGLSEVSAATIRRAHAVHAPLVGASRPERIGELERAAEVRLSAADLAVIDSAVPDTAVAGTRYATPLLALLDSER